jgi:porphyrinogen peroxidase
METGVRSAVQSPNLMQAAAQQATAKLTPAAIMLTLQLKPGPSTCEPVRSFCADLAALVRAVGFRDVEGRLSCVLGIGSDAWDHLFGSPRPAELHPFREIRSGPRCAVATPGDLLLHIRARSMDLCFELAMQIMQRLGAVAEPVDEMQGFRYFDDRDLLGFVDGTENPTGGEAEEAVLIGSEDPPFAGGSYVIVQKYLHDLERWNQLPTEEQERIVGRRKLSDIELDDAIKPSYAHNALTSIVENGKEVKIVRANMPFGSIAQGQFGTYFIGYSRSPRTIERMLENMFIGSPPGNYDRLLDVSRAVTGGLFFVPSATFLDAAANAPAADPPAPDPDGSPAGAPTQAATSSGDGSLGIGSLKGEFHE